MAALAGRVGVHKAGVVGIRVVSGHAGGHCEMCPCEEPAGRSIAEGVGLVEAGIARQAACVVQLGVDFDDHVCRIRATLHRMGD
jgi:hypothetical protein